MRNSKYFGTENEAGETPLEVTNFKEADQYTESALPQLAVTLTSETVCLRQISEGDSETIVNSEGHEEVVKTVAWETHRTLEEFRKQMRLNRDVAWVSRDIPKGQAFGSVGLTELSPNCAEITFSLHHERWNRHPSFESLHLVLDWAFAQFPMYARIQARCFPTNVSSCSLLDNLGMRFEGVNRAIVKIRDEFFDLSCYAITREDWARRAAHGNQRRVAEYDFVHI